MINIQKKKLLLEKNGLLDKGELIGFNRVEQWSGKEQSAMLDVKHLKKVADAMDKLGIVEVMITVINDSPVFFGTVKHKDLIAIAPIIPKKD